MNKKFDSEPVYGDNGKYMKTKIVSHGDKVNTNFHSKKNIINASYKCMSQIMIDFAIKVNKKYDLQAFLKESKYKIRKNKWKFLSMMIQAQGHLVNLIMNLTMMNLMINQLKIKTVFQ